MPWTTAGQDVVSVREEPTASVSMRSRPTRAIGTGGSCVGNAVEPVISGERALEGEIKELKAKVAELEAALERKAEATTEALKDEGSEAECQRCVTCQRVQTVAAAAPDDRECAALRRGQLTSDRVEARQNRLINSTRVTEDDRVRPYRPARNRKPTKASLGSTTWPTRSSATLERR
jgi:hypothetical protein